MSGAIETARRTVVSAAETTGRVAKRLLLGAFALGYLTLWGGLAARHYATGDIADAVLTLVVFVVPFVGLVLYGVSKRYDTPEIGAEGTPSLS